MQHLQTFRTRKGDEIAGMSRSGRLLFVPMSGLNQPTMSEEAKKVLFGQTARSGEELAGKTRWLERFAAGTSVPARMIL